MWHQAIPLVAYHWLRKNHRLKGTGVESGTWADWVSGLGGTAGAGAAIVAWWTTRKQLKYQRYRESIEDELRITAQARRILISPVTIMINSGLARNIYQLEDEADEIQKLLTHRNSGGCSTLDKIPPADFSIHRQPALGDGLITYHCSKRLWRVRNYSDLPVFDLKVSYFSSSTGEEFSFEVPVVLPGTDNRTFWGEEFDDSFLDQYPDAEHYELSTNLFELSSFEFKDAAGRRFEKTNDGIKELDTNSE